MAIVTLFHNNIDCNSTFTRVCFWHEEGQLTVQLRKITICPAPSALLDGGNDYKVVCCCHGGGRESTMLSSLQSHVGGELALRLLVPQGRPLLEDLTPTISLRCDPRRIDRRLPECVILPWLPPCYASRTTTDLEPANLPEQAAEHFTVVPSPQQR